jgi:hypothetical protein
MSKRRTGRKQRDLFHVEAERLAALPVRDRKAALDVHRRIAEDARLSDATREHARTVADTLEKLIAEIRKKNDTGIDGR